MLCHVSSSLQKSDRQGLKQTLLASLLVGVLVGDAGPVQSEIFEVVKQRSDLFFYVCLKDEDTHVLLFGISVLKDQKVIKEETNREVIFICII